MALKKELLYDGKCYDVTNWAKKHPGGKIIELYLSPGEDSTHVVQQFHSRSTKKVMSILKSLPQRNACEEDQKMDSVKKKRHKDLTADFLELFQQFQEEGMFKPDLPHVILRLLEVLLLGLAAIFLVLLQPQTIASRTLGIVFGALCAGRAGWVLHEGGHHSLTGIPKFDRFIQTFLIGFVYGLSGSYWVSQHSRHHAMPQHIKNDVDIQTSPLLAFHRKLVKNPKEGKGFLIQNQKWLFLTCNNLLIVMFWNFYLHPKYCLHKKKYFDLLCMGLHHAAMLYLGFVNCFVVKYLTSIYLLGNFSLSHTHLPVAEEPTHWVEYSLCHTTNIRSSWWVDYWMGYLNYQIEHHLFPTMPQYRNKLCRDRVKALAKKHNLPYHLVTYREAVVKTFENLETVSKELALED